MLVKLNILLLCSLHKLHPLWRKAYHKSSLTKGRVDGGVIKAWRGGYSSFEVDCQVKHDYSSDNKHRVIILE